MPPFASCAALPQMLVLTWNLFHGRTLPPTPRGLLGEFATELAGWAWDVALLQEVPPWWPAELARAAGAEHRVALTSRNALPGLRRALAVRNPELIKSNGGGCNAVLSRAPISEHVTLRLRIRPERRVAQLLRLVGGVCVANLHASTRVALADDELRRLWRHALRFADDDPLVLGGDLNLRKPRAPSADITHVAGRDVDHIFVRRLAQVGEAEVLARRVEFGDRHVELSDHSPLRVRLQGR